MAPSKETNKQDPNGEELVALNLRLQNEILQTQLQTGLLTLERQKDENAHYLATKEKRKRDNAQRQANFAAEIAGKAAAAESCLHKQGGKHDMLFEGNGPSALTRSETFFDGNEVIQCNRCGLLMARPLPILRKKSPKLYEAAMALYNRLRKESISNGLAPMKSPTFSFTNVDGLQIMPALR